MSYDLETLEVAADALDDHGLSQLSKKLRSCAKALKDNAKDIVRAEIMAEIKQKADAIYSSLIDSPRDVLDALCSELTLLYGHAKLYIIETEQRHLWPAGNNLTVGEHHVVSAPEAGDRIAAALKIYWNELSPGLLYFSTTRKVYLRDQEAARTSFCHLEGHTTLLSLAYRVATGEEPYKEPVKVRFIEREELDPTAPMNSAFYHGSRIYGYARRTEGPKGEPLWQIVASAGAVYP